jgi:hypothetical protein
LPLPLHLASSVIEWLLIYSTSIRLDAAASTANAATSFNTSSSSSSSGGFVSSWLQPGQLLLSLLCVVLLPTLGVARLQQQQRATYEQLKAAAQDQGYSQQEQQAQQQDTEEHTQPRKQRHPFNDDSCFNTAPLLRQQDKTGNYSSSVNASTDNTAENSRTAVNVPATADACSSNAAGTTDVRDGSSSRKGRRTSNRRDSAAEQFLADIESSLRMTTAAAAAAAARPSSSSSSSSGPPQGQLHGLAPALSGLLGDEGAAAVFLAAAAAAAPAGPACGGGAGGIMRPYTSMAQALPASIKVSCVSGCMQSVC